MSVLDMYSEFRGKFTEITKRADIEHMRIWGEVKSEFAYSWFESLANALNREMLNEVEARIYKDVFEYFRSKFLFGNDEIKNCIEVSFVENLFWSVPPEKAKGYWDIFPDLLKDLYVQFHRRAPA